jgi:hypothetical protein
MCLTMSSWDDRILFERDGIVVRVVELEQLRSRQFLRLRVLLFLFI